MTRLIYTAGPISEFVDKDETIHPIRDNVLEAARFSHKLWDLGYTPIIPHLLSAYEFLINQDWDDFTPMSVQYWEYSKGARAELDLATKLEMSIYKYPEIPPYLK